MKYEDAIIGLRYGHKIALSKWVKKKVAITWIQLDPLKFNTVPVSEDFEGRREGALLISSTDSEGRMKRDRYWPSMTDKRSSRWVLVGYWRSPLEEKQKEKQGEEKSAGGDGAQRSSEAETVTLPTFLDTVDLPRVRILSSPPTDWGPLSRTPLGNIQGFSMSSSSNTTPATVTPPADISTFNISIDEPGYFTTGITIGGTPSFTITSPPADPDPAR